MSQPDFTSRIPGVTHRLDTAGLTLDSTYDGPEGTVSTSVSWADTDVALANYGNAMRAFESRLPDIIATQIPAAGSRHSRLRRGRFFDVIFHTGRPVQWLPHVSLAEREVRVGWLLGAIRVRRSTRR